MCRRQSTEGASIFHDPPLVQKLQCPLHLSDPHTVGEERKREEIKFNEKKQNQMKGTKESERVR